MSILEKIELEARKLDATRQQQVLAYVELVAEPSHANPAEEESELEWASFENRAAEASA